MADLVECSRCGRRFVGERAETVAGAVVCPGCAPEARAAAKTQADREVAERSRQKLAAVKAAVKSDLRACDRCGKRLDKEFLVRRYGKSLCAPCAAAAAEESAPGPAPAAAAAKTPEQQLLADVGQIKDRLTFICHAVMFWVVLTLLALIGGCLAATGAFR